MKKVKLKPGQKGTKRLMAQYGSALLCVRYRYDEMEGRKIKTAEIIVEESAWTPAVPRYPASAVVALRIRAEEKELQKQAKLAGGTWDRDRQVWLVRYGCIAGTSLEKLIVKESPKGP